MMADFKIKLRPWIVPNFATIEGRPGSRQDGWKDASGIPISELPAETLAQMADEWRAELFDKAGKKDPRA